MPSARPVAVPTVMVSTMWRHTRPAGVLERGGRLHDAAQASVIAVPDVGAAVADLRERHADGLERGDLVVLVEQRVGLGILGLGREARRLLGLGAGLGQDWDRCRARALRA